MTRKHFEALALEISKIPDRESRWAAYNAVATACESFNPKFDRSVFCHACGVF